MARTSCFAGLLGLLFLGLVSARASEAAPSGAVVQLPPFEVSGRNPWLYGEVPGMAVLSLEGEKDTREFVEQYRRVRRFLPLFLPAGRNVEFTTPSTLVLNPYSNERLLSDATTRLREKMRRDFNVVSLAAVRNGSLYDFSSTRAASRANDAARAGFYGYSFLVTPDLPTWYVEGINQLLRTARVGTAEMELSPREWLAFDRLLGNLSPARIIRSLPEIVHPPELLSIRTDAQFEERVRTGGARYHELMRTSAALFIYWGLFSDGGRNRAAFVEMASSGAPGTDATFQKHFGMTTPRLEESVLDYLLDRGRTDKLVLPAALAQPMPPLVLRPATRTEVARISGEAYVFLALSPDSGNAAAFYELRAREALDPVYEAGERDPRFLAALGFLEHRAGRFDRAREHLDAAVKGGAASQHALYLQAQLRLDEAGARPGDGRALEEAAATRALAPLRDAMRMNPVPFPVYELFADIVSRGGSVLSDEDFALLARGLEEYPSDDSTAYLYQLARLGVRSRKPELVRQTVARLLANPRVPEEHRLHAALLEVRQGVGE